MSTANLAVDRTLFFGPRMPEEVSKSLGSLRKSDKGRLRKVLEIAVESLKTEGDWATETGRDSEAFTRLRAMADAVVAAGVGAEEAAVQIGGVVALLRAAVRLPALKSNVLKDDLMSLGLPAEFVADFVKVVDASRQSLAAVSLGHRVALPSLDRLQWRVDVTISTSSLARALKPVILMQLTLSDGSVKTFEVSPSQFHELRFNTALLLKEVEGVEQKNIFKIKD